MKLLLIAAFIAVVASDGLSEQQPEHQQDFPWQTGKVYHYQVNSHTLSHLHEGQSSGSAFKAYFIVRVKSPGRLQAKLKDPHHAQFHEQLLNNMDLPADLRYKSIQNLDKPFEIIVEEGRFKSLNLPSTLSVSNENLIKGLLSSLQVDLSSRHHVRSLEDNYNNEHQQGLFSKFETDVTGDCETLYLVSPVAAEWRRELPHFASEEDPIEVTKSRNYRYCHHRVAYHFGIPEGAVWTGTAHKNNEKQFISHGTVSRLLVGKKGPIYKAETTSSVHVHPHVYGKQKAEVHSFIKFVLVSVEQDNGSEWKKPEGYRQAMTLMFALTTKQMDVYEPSSSTSQSSEESHEHINEFEDLLSELISEALRSHRRELEPKINEPGYIAMYWNSQTSEDRKQNPMSAQKLLLDLAQQLQNPHYMPKADFLGKFNILVRVIASMTTDQLAQTSRSIELAKTSNNIIKTDMWMIFRDAVIQSGTSPAFQQIAAWIKSKKLQNEEAAQALSSLAKTLRYPTKELMTQFFDLAMCSEVQKQNFLNSSALIAATTFIRLGQVNNETARAYYPTLMFGRLASELDRFVIDDILPKLSQQLKYAVENDERNKARVYIKAIGNLGLGDILQVFAPYLEGRYQVSTYLRVQMISELRSLVDQNDKYIRAVLYSILRNTAEPYEVRVAAAFNIFRANPSTAMMQGMAQMTNDDPSIQVRAALKSGIETAANLKEPRFWHLLKSARAVKDLVTSDNLGIKYSSAVFFNEYDSYEYDNDAQLLEASIIDSEDSFSPKTQTITWRNKISGPGIENTVQWSLSSVKDFVDYIKQMVFEPRKSDAKHKYSAKKISEMLSIKHDPQDALESSFYINALGQERLITLDEEDLNRLAQDVREYLKDMEKGIEKHYTKVFNAKQISVMFPIATGVPFIYNYKKPILIHIQGKASGKIDKNNKNFKDRSAKIDKEIQFTAARNIDGSVGFMDTLSNQFFSAGVIKKYQLNIPLKMMMDVKSGAFKLRLEPLQPDQDTTIAHYSMWPYTTIQKKNSLTSTSQDPGTKLVRRQKKLSSTDFRFGQQIGNIFHIKGYSYSKNFRHVDNPLQALFNIDELIGMQDIALTNYNFRYLGKQSKNKAITFTAVYDEYHNLKQSGEFGQAKRTNDVTANSAFRREKLVKHASSGINTARTSVIDLSATFEGAQKEEYVLTAAFAASLVDRKRQASLFFGRNSAQHGNEQINAVYKAQKPELTPLNFYESLKRDLKGTYELDIKYGQNSTIHIQNYAERSKEYSEQLKQHPWARQCEQQMNNDNQFQTTCQKMLVLAHALNSFKFSVNYKNVSQSYIFWGSPAYGLFNPLNQHNETILMKRVADGKLELEAEASYLTNSLRLNMTSSPGMLHLENIEIPDFIPYLLSAYSPFKAMSGFEHLANYKTDYRYQPFCTIDKTKIKTFSNRSYQYELSRSWHVVMHQEAFNKRGQWDEILILSRRPSEKQLHVYISHKTETGYDLELNIPPAAAKNKAELNIKTNGKKISDGDLTTYWDDAAESPLLQYFTHPDGVLMLNIRDGHLRITFDGQRLILSTSEYRKTTRGICGQNTGDPRDDYKTPNGLVDQPQYYGASYALDDENSDPKTQELKKQAQQMAYQLRMKNTIILQSNEDWKPAQARGNEEYSSQSVSKTTSYQKHRGQCKLHQQVQYQEKEGEICITTAPLASCHSQCRCESYEVRSVQIVCKSKADQQFQSYKKQIKQGYNPQVSGVPKVVQYRVPKLCTL